MFGRKKIKFTRAELFFYLGYFLYSLSIVVIGNSYLFGTNRFVIANVVSYLAAALLLVSFCFQKHKMRELFFRVIIGLFVFFVGLRIHSVGTGVIALLMMASEKIKFERIVKLCVYCNLLFLFIVITSSLMGFIPNQTFYHNGLTAYGFGFAYFSNVPFSVFLITIMAYWLAKTGKRENLVLFLSLPANLFCYKYGTVRLTFFCYIIFIVLVIISKIINLTKNRKWYDVVVSVMYPIVAIFTIAISLIKNRFPIIQTLDVLLNYRLSFNLQGIQRYGISLLGHKIENVAEYWDENYINHYFFIDCGYVSTLLNYGIVLFVIILFLYSFLSHYAVRSQDSKLLILCVIICIFSVVNNVLFSMSSNPLTLIAFNLLRLLYKQRKTGNSEIPGRIMDL